MVGDDQYRLAMCNCAFDAQLDTEQAADLAVIPMRKGAGAAC